MCEPEARKLNQVYKENVVEGRQARRKKITDALLGRVRWL